MVGISLCIGVALTVLLIHGFFAHAEKATESKFSFQLRLQRLLSSAVITLFLDASVVYAAPEISLQFNDRVSSLSSAVSTTVSGTSKGSQRFTLTPHNPLSGTFQAYAIGKDRKHLQSDLLGQHFQAVRGEDFIAMSIISGASFSQKLLVFARIGGKTYLAERQFNASLPSTIVLQQPEPLRTPLCSSETAHHDFEHTDQRTDQEPSMNGEEVARATTGEMVLRVGGVLDYEAVQFYGGDPVIAVQNALAMVNSVDALYQATWGLRVVLSYVFAFSSPQDPFSLTTQYGMLGETNSFFRDWVEGELTRGSEFLWTGRDLNGSAGVTNGTSCISQRVCMTSYGMGWSTMCTAHELGHQIALSHDSAGCGGPHSTLMCPAGGDLTFSPASVTDGANFLASAQSTCIHAPSFGRSMSPPINLIATDGAYSSQVRITANIPDTGAYQGYKLYRSISPEGCRGTEIANWSMFGNFSIDSIDNVTPGIRYYYSAQLKTAPGLYTACSAVDMGYAGTNGPPPPSAPASVSASNAAYSNRVQVSWSAVPGAQKYRVFRAESLQGPFTRLVAEVNGTSFDDTNVGYGKTYYYYVRTFSSSNESLSSATAVGRTSSAAAPPIIVTQPQSGSYVIGETISLGVAVEGAGPFIYQWKKNGVDLSNQTGPQLQLGSAHQSHEGSYQVLITNSAGSVISNEAIITIEALPCSRADIDGNGWVSSQDLAPFLAAWGSSDSRFDFTADGQVNTYDLSFLLACWGGV